MLAVQRVRRGGGEVSDTVTIRKTPTPADLNAIVAVAKTTVLEMAKMDGVLGHDAISLLYVQRIYEAIVAREVKLRKARK